MSTLRSLLPVLVVEPSDGLLGTLEDRPPPVLLPLDRPVRLEVQDLVPRLFPSRLGEEHLVLDRREERLRYRRLHRSESGQAKVEEDHVRSVRHLAFVDLVPAVGEVLDLVTNDGKAVRSQVSSEETDGQVHCRNVKRRYS